MKLLDIIRGGRPATNYDPKKASDGGLLEDWKFVVESWGKSQAGSRTGFASEVEVLDSGALVVQELLARDRHTFSEKGNSLKLLRIILERLVEEGPLVDAGHAEALYRGKEKALARRSPLDLLLQTGIMFSGKLAWGFARFGRPDQVNVKEFDSMVRDHGVSPSERETRWGGARKLWVYPLRDLVKFEEPRKVELPPGDRVYVEDAQFQESSFVPRDWDLQKLSDADLLRLHAQVHEEAVEFRQKNGKAPGEELIDRHALVLEELRRRKLEHRPFTELDFLTQEFLKRAKGDATKEKIKLSDVYNLVQEDFAIVQPLLSFTGGVAVQGWGEDVDVHVNLPAAERKLLDSIIFRLLSSFPPAWRERIHFIPDPNGPITNSIPFADLVVRVRKPEDRALLRMSEAVPAGMAKQAEKSRRANRITPGQFFTQLKSQKGYRAGEEVEWEKIKGWATGLKPVASK